MEENGPLSPKNSMKERKPKKNFLSSFDKRKNIGTEGREPFGSNREMGVLNSLIR
ncbi:hypothetical protein QJS04_geneDACA018960 [Acorus gramineus]|uniref:Uncharacterized protein n=1 Tax=Acorus gramineus TaxID=55184 RepID=A0AAV9AEK1_ACOGR|nr:hypothetical protein QJS04_geneDACA018960 [Acorus gramineus]